MERALDESEEQQFWAAVRQTHAEADAPAQGEDLSSVALGDDLHDPDDDALGRDGW